MERHRFEWTGSGIAKTWLRRAWKCSGMAKQGSDEQWNGKEKLVKAMAMDARRSIDRRRQ
jgi:hypothetical protein